MTKKKTSSGFANDAADKIWNDHLGNNAFVQHRNQCATCSDAFRERSPGQQASWCTDGSRIFDNVLDEVYAKIDEVTLNQN